MSSNGGILLIIIVRLQHQVHWMFIGAEKENYILEHTFYFISGPGKVCFRSNFKECKVLSFPILEEGAFQSVGLAMSQAF